MSAGAPLQHRGPARPGRPAQRRTRSGLPPPRHLRRVGPSDPGPRRRTVTGRSPAPVCPDHAVSRPPLTLSLSPYDTRADHHLPIPGQQKEGRFGPGGLGGGSPPKLGGVRGSPTPAGHQWGGGGPAKRGHPDLPWGRGPGVESGELSRRWIAPRPMPPASVRVVAVRGPPGTSRTPGPASIVPSRCRAAASG